MEGSKEERESKKEGGKKEGKTEERIEKEGWGRERKRTLW